MRAAVPSKAPTVTIPVPPMPAARMETGCWQSGKPAPESAQLVDARRRLAQTAAFNGHQAWTEAVQAGIVLVAGGLVDLALDAEFGGDGPYGEAIGFGAAVAAALANGLVDDNAARGIGKLAALAAPPLLGRAGLVVDQRRDAAKICKLALHAIELVAMIDRHQLRYAGVPWILVRVVRNERDPLDAFCAWSCRVSCGTVKVPSSGWPPVIATASL